MLRRKTNLHLFSAKLLKIKWLKCETEILLGKWCVKIRGNHDHDQNCCVEMIPLSTKYKADSEAVDWKAKVIGGRCQCNPHSKCQWTWALVFMRLWSKHWFQQIHSVVFIYWILSKFHLDSLFFEWRKTVTWTTLFNSFLFIHIIYIRWWHFFLHLFVELFFFFRVVRFKWSRYRILPLS